MIELAAQNSAFRGLILLLIFGVVAALSLLVLAIANRRIATRSQLDKLQAMDFKIATRGQSLRSRDSNTAWAKLAAAIEAAGLNLTDTKSERLTELLRQAGYTSAAAPRVYTLARLGLTFALPLGYVLLAYSSGGDPPSFLKVYLVG